MTPTRRDREMATAALTVSLPGGAAISAERERCARACEARAEQYDAQLDRDAVAMAYAAEARECAVTIRFLGIEP
jgi:hypothetical protein